MSIIDNIDFKSVTTGNALYEQHYARWKYLYDSYVGGQEYKNGQYLTRYQLETPAEYLSRINSTPLQNHCASVMSVYNSFLFRVSPERELGALAETPEIEDFMDDVDYEGRSINNFMKEVSTWAGVFGHSWIIVTKANIDAATLADEQVNGIRPYVSLLTPLVVLDWEWDRAPNGKYDLALFKYIEDVNGNTQTVRTWTRESITTHTVDLRNETVLNELIEVNQLGKIPAVIAYNTRSIVRGIGISAVNDIADMQRSIYNSLSEVDQSIRLDSHPSLVKTPETQAGIGAGSLILMPENLDPNLKPYVLDFAGANIPNIYISIDNAVGSIEKMAALGAVRATQASAMSGVALDTEFQLLNSRLSEMADNLESAEEGIWRLYCQYQSIPFDISIEYPESFNIHDSSADIAQLKIASETGSTDPKVRAGIDLKIINWLDLEEEQWTEIDANLTDEVEPVEEAPMPQDMQDNMPSQLND